MLAKARRIAERSKEIQEGGTSNMISEGLDKSIKASDYEEIAPRTLRKSTIKKSVNAKKERQRAVAEVIFSLI